MKRILPSVFCWLAVVMALSACAPVSPTPATPSIESAETKLAEACKSYMDLNPSEVFAHFPYDVFWTFHTNFYEPGEENVRLGCLHFYWRDTTNLTFTGSLDSAVLVSCSVEARADHDPNRPRLETSPANLESSAAQRRVSLPEAESLPNRRTVFPGTAYVVCPLHIAGALEELLASGRLAGDLGNLSPDDAARAQAAIEAMIAQPEIDYPEFTLAAAVQFLSDAPKVQPIVTYLPAGDVTNLPGGSSPYEVALELENLNSAPPAFRFSTTFSGGTHVSDEFQSSACYVPALLQKPSYLWQAFGPCPHLNWPGCGGGDPVYLHFHQRREGELVEQCVVETAQLAATVVHFTTGPALVYIGYRPQTDAVFAGNLYEIWVDPNSAIRPPQ